MTLITHELLAILDQYEHGKAALRNACLLVDEIDLAAHPDWGWKGLSCMNEAAFLYGVSATKLTEAECLQLELPKNMEVREISVAGAIVTRELEVRPFVSNDDVAKFAFDHSQQEPVVLFYRKAEEAEAAYEELAKQLAPEQKNHAYYFDPESHDPTVKGNNSRVVKRLNEPHSECRLVITSAVGMRGINYWNTCASMAAFDLDVHADYLQFMGRSNRLYPMETSQRGVVFTTKKGIKSQEDYEENLPTVRPPRRNDEDEKKGELA